MPSELERVMAAHRRALAAEEKAARDEILRAYAVIRRRILRSLDDVLTGGVVPVPLRGETVAEARLREETRYRDLLSQVETELNRFARQTSTITARLVTNAVDVGQVQALEAMTAAMGEKPRGVGITFNRLPRAAIESALSAQQQGSPLRALFQSFGENAAERVQTALISAIAEGMNPRQTAREVKQALNVSAIRALTIARTEQLRAFNTSSLETYAANHEIVDAWIWTCAQSDRTCLPCLALDGTEWELDTMMPIHPNCRCTLRPKVKTWRELGLSNIPEPSSVIDSGVSWFKRQDATTQQKMMTQAEYKAFKSGDVELKDFVGMRQNKIWGASVYKRSLKEIFG